MRFPTFSQRQQHPTEKKSHPISMYQIPHACTYSITVAKCAHYYTDILLDGIPKVGWFHKAVTLSSKFTSLSGHAPSRHHADDCCLITDARPRKLHSAKTPTLLVSWMWTNFGDKSL